MDTKITYLGQTAGGILKTARMQQMRAGNWEVVVTTRDGREHHAIQGGRNGCGETIDDVLYLVDVSGTNAALLTSATAYANLRDLSKQCAARMLAVD